MEIVGPQNANTIPEFHPYEIFHEGAIFEMCLKKFKRFPMTQESNIPECNTLRFLKSSWQKITRYISMALCWWSKVLKLCLTFCAKTCMMSWEFN